MTSAFDAISTFAQDQKDARVDTAATTTRLDTTLTQSVGGFGGGGNDQFERVDTDLGADWSIVDTGAGELATDGRSAVWSPSGGSANRVIARNTTVTLSPTAHFTRVVLAEPLNDVSSWILYARMNTAQDTYVYGLFRRNYREIGYAVAGVETVLDSSSDPFNPAVGTTIDLICYEDLESYALLTSQVEFFDTTSSSPSTGDSYTYCGFGCDVQTQDGQQVSPGAVALWAATEVAADVVGVFFEAIPSVDKSGLSDFVGAFDGVNFQSKYLTYNDSTSELTVELPGAYAVTIYWKAGLSPIASSKVLRLQLKRGGFVAEESTALKGDGSSDASVTLHWNTTIYLLPGDVIQPAFYISPGETLDMEWPDSFFRVAKMSPPYFA